MQDYDADAAQLSHMLTVWGLRLELENMRQIYFFEIRFKKRSFEIQIFFVSVLK